MSSGMHMELQHVDAAAIEARHWREQCGYVGRGGVVVVYGGTAQGWVNTLRNPEHWQPGCVAVDEAGHTWVAVAGDGQDGARMWMPTDSQSWSASRPASPPTA